MKILSLVSHKIITLLTFMTYTLSLRCHDGRIQVVTVSASNGKSRKPQAPLQIEDQLLT